MLDTLTAQTKASPRLRCNLDLRNSPEDNSQRMLNAIEPGTVMPVHRLHSLSPGTVVLSVKGGKWESLEEGGYVG